ncbi:hypothetical protein [Paenibacillus taichungensis]|uniref:hypothetical protein n=1 Tax=Paenibacillus taichungensis TaxID=484184 RepID=UPI00158623E0|nr:hypothetical protein [Paenibacillus taichungensis]
MRITCSWTASLRKLLLRQLTDRGLPVLEQIMEMIWRYFVQGQRKHIKGSVVVHTSCGLPVKLVFARNWNKRREQLTTLIQTSRWMRLKLYEFTACVGVLNPILRAN